MKNITVKLLSLLLAVIMTAALFVSCTPSGDDKPESVPGENDATDPIDTEPIETDLPTPTEDVNIVEGGKATYKIVRSENAQSFEKSAASTLASIFGFSLTWEAVIRAFFMILRIMMLITGTFLLTYTTSPIALTDGLEALLSPLKRIKFPVHELSMMMCIALRFIPTLIEETDKIMSAQKARGADFESGSIMDRAKALIPILVPLFISAFRRADELATAMECRCYQGGEGRTKMKLLRYSRWDFNAFFVGIGLIIVVVALGSFGL